MSAPPEPNGSRAAVGPVLPGAADAEAEPALSGAAVAAGPSVEASPPPEAAGALVASDHLSKW